MTSYVVRKGREEDLEDLFRLILGLAEHENVKVATITREIIREDAFGERPYLTFYVGEYFRADEVVDDTERRSGKIVGFASINQMHNICYGRSAYLNGLFVEEEHRDNGLGTAIMKAVVKDCVYSGHVSLNWDVLAKNLRTRRFYSRIGVTNNTEKAQWEYWQFNEPDMKNFVADMTIQCPDHVKIEIHDL